MSAGPLEAAEARARRCGRCRGRRHQSISSPGQQDEDVLEVRRPALALGRPAVGLLDAEDGDARARAPRAQPDAAAAASTSASFARRAVDLDRLAAGVLGDELRRRPGGDGAAVRHDHHGVGEALGLLDVVRRHEDRRALGAQRVDQRPQLLPDLRVEADGRLVEQHEPRPVHQRARDQQAAAHAAGELVDARVAPVDEVRHLERALDRVAPLGRGRCGRGA